MYTLLPRIHLFEWEDQTFFHHHPQCTDAIFIYGLWDSFIGTLPVHPLSSKRGRTNIYDLCSGDGLVTHLARLSKPSNLLLTSRTIIPTSLRSRHYILGQTVQSPSTLVCRCRSAVIPKILSSRCCCLSSLHAWRRTADLAQCHSAKCPIAIFEIQQRSCLTFCWCSFVSHLLVDHPFMKPSLTQLLFTYWYPSFHFALFGMGWCHHFEPIPSKSWMSWCLVLNKVTRGKQEQHITHYTTSAIA